jgi:hypothetical protein
MICSTLRLTRYPSFRLAATIGVQGRLRQSIFLNSLLIQHHQRTRISESLPRDAVSEAAARTTKAAPA